jgi:glucose/arabinose dehydrogenase
MKNMHYPVRLISMVCLLYTGLAMLASCSQSLPLHLIKLPAGFSISLFAKDLPGARSMTLSPSGTLFVSTRGEGRVYALQDQNHDGVADQRFVIAEGLDTPNGIAFYQGNLYVAETSRILRYAKIETTLKQPPTPRVIYDELPTERHHGWRYLAIGPDKKLYVSVGAPCNVCDKDGYAEIKRLDLDGKHIETYARGIRNSVGFTWQPQTKLLWFTDNGRDNLGDDRPDDELNVATGPGQHFGFPYCHAGDVLDPAYGTGKSCRDYIPPVQKLGAHVASLGLRFYTGRQFPADYRHQLFIAEHGSWNRSSKVGYQVALVKLKGKQAISYTPFATGWLQGQQAWGRPVDVQVDPSGALLVSDDMAGVIYRIVYHQP